MNATQPAAVMASPVGAAIVRPIRSVAPKPDQESGQ